MIDLVLRIGIIYYVARYGDYREMFFLGSLIIMDAHGKFDFLRKIGEKHGAWVSKRLGLAKKGE
jgi:hypothetical protein